MVGTTNKSMPPPAHGYAERYPNSDQERITFPGHVLGNGRLSDLKSELEQLTMNARRARDGSQRAMRRIKCP